MFSKESSEGVGRGGPGRWTGLVLLILVGGCGMSTAGMQKSLAYASHRFNTDVRWRRHEQASALLKPALRQPYQDRTESPEDPVRVSMVEVLRAKIEPKKSRARLRVRYHWHRVDRGIQRRTVVVQHWRYTGVAWLVTRLEHGSGPEFPWFNNLKPAPKKRRAPAKPPAKRPPPR